MPDEILAACVHFPGYHCKGGVLARKFPNAAAATEGANWLSSFRFFAERTRNENDWRRT